jgi:hypothetical protein
MVFLIDYNRKEGRIVTIESFSDSDRQKAEESRFRLELDLNARSIDREVVLLDAASEAAIRRTHRRYFETLAELLTAPTKLDQWLGKTLCYTYRHERTLRRH